MITAAIVKELRDRTNAGMMDCKRVLAETNGDIEASIKLLRERGIAKAGAKADRAAKEGIIAARVSNATTGILLEINCETDFVSKNENFQAFVKEVADALEAASPADHDAALAIPHGGYSLDDYIKAKVIEVGENLRFRKYVRFAAAPGGVIGSYIHMGGKVGVLIEMGTTKAATAGNGTFLELLKDLTLHIAASAPKGLSREDIPEAVIETKRTFSAPAWWTAATRQHHREHHQGPTRQVFRRKLFPRTGFRQGSGHHRRRLARSQGQGTR